MTKQISESEINRRTELAKILSQKIDERQLTQVQAAELLCIKQSRVSNIKNLKIELFSTESLIDMIEKMGSKVSVVIES